MQSIIDIILYEDNGVEDGVHERIMKNKECKEASDKAYKVYDKLEPALTKEQLKLLDEFISLYSEEKCVANDLYFKEGVKTGMRLAVECFCE